MHKSLLFLKRRPDDATAAFFHWWRHQNSALMTRLPGLQRYTVSTAAEGDGDFDGVAELWFEDGDVARDSFHSIAGRAALGDVERRVARSERIDVEEHRFVDVGLPAPGKLIAALKRRADLSRDDFKRWWLERHAPLVVDFPELRRYQVDIVSFAHEAFVDGVAEVSYADVETAKRITSSTQVRAVQGDSQVHTSARYRMYVTEHPVVW